MVLPDEMRIQIHTDHIAEKLDEMADLCEYWKKHRSKGRTPNAIRGALVYLSQEVAAFNFSDEEAPEIFPGTLEKLRDLGKQKAPPSPNNLKGDV